MSKNWEGVSLAYFKVMPRNSHVGMKMNRKKLSAGVSNLVENRSGYLPSTNLKFFHYISLFGNIYLHERQHYVKMEDAVTLKIVTQVIGSNGNL
jgi:hypothetical protein